MVSDKNLFCMVALDPILASSKFRGIPKLVIGNFCRGDYAKKIHSCMNPAINSEYTNSTAIMENQPLSDTLDGQEKPEQRLSRIILSLTELQLEPFDQLVRAYLDRYDYIVFNCIGKVSH